MHVYANEFIGFYYDKKIRVDRSIFINRSQYCAYCRPECVCTSLVEKSLKLSLATFSNVFATLALSRENSFALSLACCTDVLTASIVANMLLFANLVATIVQSVKLLTALA
jgi:hypothetical protein